MPTFNIELTDRIFLRNHNGKAVYAEPAKFEAVLSKVCEVGIKTILTNVWNGGGANATDAEREAALNKKLDAWARGEFTVVERGESSYTPMRDAFIADCMAVGMTQAAAEAAIKEAVTERLGKDAKATFANYLQATALALVEAGEFDDADTARETLEAAYADKAQKRAEAAAKVAAKVKVPTLDLSAFKKAAKAD